MVQKKSRAVQAAIARKAAARAPAKAAPAPAAAKAAAPKAASKKEKKAASPKASPKGPKAAKGGKKGGFGAADLYPADESVGNPKFKTFDNDSCMGMTAPDLSTLDYVDTPYPKATKGKPYIMLIWAQYHKPGYKFIALYSKLAAKYRGSLDIVGAAIDPSKKDGPQKFIEDPAKKYSKGSFPMDFACAHDVGQSQKKAFADGLRATLSAPHAFLVDGKGKVVWHQDHSELGATVPTYMRLMEEQVQSFLTTGKCKKVGDKAIVESESEESSDDEGGTGVVADDLDLF